MTTKILKLPQVKDRTKMSRTAIYDKAAKGEFPKPIKLGLRASGWIEAEIDQWISDRMDARRG